MTEFVKYRVQLPVGSAPERGPGWTDLWVRDGTSDVDVIEECWVQDVYHLRGLDLWPVADPPGNLNDPNPALPFVLDIGACTGVFSALVAQMYPYTQILAVEPDAANFELLQRNTEKWRSRITCANSAVGGTRGNVSVVGDAGQAHVMAGGPVQQVTLEDLLPLEQRAALVKIDVEGGEYAILDDAPIHTMRAIDRIAMEWHGPGMCPWIDEHNRQYGDMLHKLAFTHDVHVLGDPRQGGMLWAHRYPT